MCGIVGIFDRMNQGPIDRSLLQRMNDSLSHRGPDDAGFYVSAGIGLGHRRLSIIDLASGHQPLFNEDRSVVVVYNGEIYNFQDLARELQAKGHVFRTHCDTEVIVHAWEEWGESCVDRFRGMFAFGLWDEKQGILFLARDRLGIKPLYYAELPDGEILFASELKALLVHPGLRRDFDHEAIEDYFAYGYVPDPKSIYRSVAKLPPGHVMQVRKGGATPRPRAYWDMSFEPKSRTSENDVQEELVAKLREAVDLRLISDVPLGAFLSGGVDSSAVVATMAGLSSEPVNTCSIGFTQAGFDESAYAQQVAEAFRTQHHMQVVESDSFELIDRLANIYDEPFADSSAIPTYQVCGLARERVTVALSGDGGDEVFAGYRRYRWHHYEELLRSRLPHGLRRPLFGLAGRVYPKLDWAPRPLRAKSTLEALARDSAEAYFHSVSILPDRLRLGLYAPRLRSELQGYHAVEVVKRFMTEAPAQHHLDRVQYADFKTYLPGDILTKVDRASMAHSLEVRVPLLDHPFVEWAAGLPSDLKLRGREGKFIFKKAMEPHLAKDILYREKMGFAVPLARWFRGPLSERLRSSLVDGELGNTGLFAMDHIERLVGQHTSGLRDHSAPLWALLMFESFLRNVHGVSSQPQEMPSGRLAVR